MKAKPNSIGILRPAAVAVCLLLVPLVAMQFTNEVNWDVTDFIVMGVLLFGTGVLIEYVYKIFPTPAYRSMAILAIIFLFLLIWAELAVGIFNTPWAGS